MTAFSSAQLKPGGDYKPTFFSGRLTISSGATGTLLTLTAPAGKRIRLNGLATASGTQSGISIVADGTTVVSALTLGLNAATGFTVQANSGDSATGGIPYIEALSTIVISKNAGNTTQNLSYSYSEGI